MAGMMIWLVVVLYIVIRCVNASKRNARQAKPNVPRQPVQANRTDHARTNRAGSAQTTGRWSNPQPQQRVAQQRPSQQGRMTQQKSRAAQNTKQENSILQKAKANASKQFDDDTLETRGSAELNRVPSGEDIVKDQAKAQHIHSEHGSDHHVELNNQPGVDDFDTYHLIDEVNDLIVKGYSGNLEFQRDFLSEAADMLNRMYG